MSDMGHTPGERIRARRLALGLTQSELAGRLGVTQPALSQWESGKSTPKAHARAGVAVQLGTTVEELFAA